MTLLYQTKSSIPDCIRSIVALPQIYFDYTAGAAVLEYKAQIVGSTSVLITFCGGQFRKFMRTVYLAVFSVEGDQTLISLHFKRDFLGLPAMTPFSDIDMFMQQKVSAQRIG